MSFTVKDILSIMEEYNMDLLQLRKAILAFRKDKSIDSSSKVDVSSRDIDDLFNWGQIKALEDPNTKH